jgi:hypothetical protein
MSTSTSTFTKEELKKAEAAVLEVTKKYVRDSQPPSVFTQKSK